jgi:hypothetical protein
MEAGMGEVVYIEPAKSVRAVEAWLIYIEQPPLKILKYENGLSPVFRIRIRTGSRSREVKKFPK